MTHLPEGLNPNLSTKSDLPGDPCGAAVERAAAGGVREHRGKRGGEPGGCGVSAGACGQGRVRGAGRQGAAARAGDDAVLRAAGVLAGAGVRESDLGGHGVLGADSP